MSRGGLSRGPIWVRLQPYLLLHVLSFRRLSAEAECHAWGSGWWTQSMETPFFGLAREHSLREDACGLPSCAKACSLRQAGSKAVSLGLRQRAPIAATVPGSSSHLQNRLPHPAPARRRKPFRVKKPLVSVAATLTDLVSSLFIRSSGPGPSRTERTLQAHHLGHDGSPPPFACSTEGKPSDLPLARWLHLPPGIILVSDQGTRSRSKTPGKDTWFP